MNFTFKILLLFVSLIKCNFKPAPVNFTQSEDGTEMERFDTMVVSKIIPAEISGFNYIEKEYIIVLDKDTSSFSCIISKNKQKGSLSIRCYNSLFGKASDSLFLKDSAAIGNNTIQQYYTPNYKNQVNEFKIILESIAKEYDLRKLNFFRFDMLIFKSFSQSIAKQYINLYGEDFGDNSNKKVVDLINKSKLVVDLNRIFIPYSLMINKTFIDGLAYYTPLRNNEASKKIIDGLVIFSLTPISPNPN